jgi:hypothetical protein
MTPIVARSMSSAGGIYYLACAIFLEIDGLEVPLLDGPAATEAAE